MTYYELFQQSPDVFLPVILTSLAVTLIAYGAFPLIFARTRKNVITKKRYNRLCYCVNLIVMVLFIVFNGEASSGGPYLLWTWIFSASGIKTLKHRGILDGFQTVKPKIEEAAPLSTAETSLCYNCGNTVIADAHFCPHCGKNLDQTNLCPSCSAVLDANMVFCPKCGTHLRSETTENDQGPKQPEDCNTSLSNVGDMQLTPRTSFDVFGKDLQLETAPVHNEVHTYSSTTPPRSDTGNIYDPVRDAKVRAKKQGQNRSLEAIFTFFLVAVLVSLIGIFVHFYMMEKPSVEINHSEEYTEAETEPTPEDESSTLRLRQSAIDRVLHLDEYTERHKEKPQPISRPGSGKILAGQERWGESKIEVTASNNYDCVVSLKTIQGKNRVSFYVRAGETVTVGVPAEHLYVYFASGEEWYGYGEGLMFGEDTSYSKDDELLDFSQYTWEYTLYPITNGNFSETPSDEDEFF